VLGDFLTTVLEIQPGLQYENATAQAKKSFALLYWWNERIMQVLVFLLVFSLIYRAAAHQKTRHLLLLGVVCGILLFAGITLIIYYDPSKATGRWITPWLRNLNFCAAILDLGLWALLIGAPRKNYTLLMVSGALGIQFTGGAIGQAVRQLSHSSVEVTAYFMPVSTLICLYILWRAFRTSSAPVDSSPRGPRIPRTAE
jgi:protein-S-isoprenylcysteine O-methyltransferase Ste14